MRRLCWLIALGGCGTLGDAPDLSDTGGPGPVVSSGLIPGGTAADSNGGDGSSDEGGPAEGGGWCGALMEPVAHCQPDGGGPAFECDLAKEDCPVGDKCIGWANDGGSIWNATRCSPIDQYPDSPGEACTVNGQAHLGLDSCALGSMCWGVDPTTLTGECVSYCTGPARGQGLCDDPDDHCLKANGGALRLCLPGCNPLGDDCDDGEACVPNAGNDWVCAPTLTSSAKPREACEYTNACAAGSVCADPTPACEPGAVACCIQVCDVSSSGTCGGADETCHPVYAAEQAPLGLETLGLCGVEPTLPKWFPQQPVYRSQPTR